MNIVIRKATQADLIDIKTILSFYFLDTENLEKHLAESIVAEKNEKIIGCACLDPGDIVELRFIAVLPSIRNKGIGGELVDAILNRAKYLTDVVYLRTRNTAFFEKKGFKRLPDAEKKLLWEDCRQCDEYNICNQRALSHNPVMNKK